MKANNEIMNENINMRNANTNEIAKQYYPLVLKIAHQVHTSSGYDLNDCIGAGNIGLIYAIDNYDVSKQEGKKKQTFTQYAAYMIRFSILNDITRNGHTIRVNQGQQAKLKDVGQSVDICVSIDSFITTDKSGERNNTLENRIAGTTESSIYAALDPTEDMLWKSIKQRLEIQFSERDNDIFFSTFGVCGYEETDGKVVAKRYNVSPGAITQIRNKMVRFIQKDTELREMFISIMQLHDGVYGC